MLDTRSKRTTWASWVLEPFCTSLIFKNLLIEYSNILSLFGKNTEKPDLAKKGALCTGGRSSNHGFTDPCGRYLERLKNFGSSTRRGVVCRGLSHDTEQAWMTVYEAGPKCWKIFDWLVIAVFNTLGLKFAIHCQHPQLGDLFVGVWSSFFNLPSFTQNYKPGWSRTHLTQGVYCQCH